MLHINDLTYRIEGRVILDRATVAVPTGHKVGIVGRNGAGKTTLLRLISGDISPDDGEISLPKRARLGYVTQEAPAGSVSLLDTVLAADKERAALLAEADSTTDAHRISEIQLRLSDIDAHSAPSRAATILAGLGFDEEAQARATSEFSGGWRMRVALASVLFTAPDVLLLDEPNNYLDLEGTLWLESFLRTYPHTVLIVSHDRDLLNKAVGGIIHLNNQNLSLYAGGYDQFEETRREQQRLQLKLKKKQDDARRHMEAFVERFRAKATKARQAQSKLKALARMKPIAAEIDEHVVPFSFPNPEKSLGDPLMRLEAAGVGYEPEKFILQDLNLRIDSNDRIGLLGANGNGKSTFAKLLSGKLVPMTGHRRCSKKIEIGYFAQHQLDELNPKKTPYDVISDLMEDATEAQKRAKLGALGFGIAKADTKAEKLSGGEKARLLLAIATFHAPHLLLLDEPTNHLDVDSRESLIHAINGFDGAVILISHDRHLVSATADRLWIVRDGTVRVYDGDMESYRAECLGEKNTPKPVAGADEDKGADAKLSRQDARRLAAQRREALAPLRKEMTRLEKQVEQLTNEIARLDEKLGDMSIYEKDPDGAQTFAQQRQQRAKDLEQAEEAWLLAVDAYETAEAESAA